MIVWIEGHTKVRMSWPELSEAGLRDADAPFGRCELEPRKNWGILEDFLRLMARDNGGTL